MAELFRPATPSPPDLIAASDTGSSNTDNITSDTTPTLTGKAEAGSIVELFSDGNSLGSTTADGSGNWRFTVPDGSELAEGSYAITATASKISGGSAATLQSTPIAPASPGRTNQEWRNWRAFAALKEDGSVITWGGSTYGGDSSSVAGDLLSGVSQIFSNFWAFAALKEDGSVITWGDKETWGAGDSSFVAGDLQAGVSQIFSSRNAFAALKEDGSVITWGGSHGGGDSSSVSNDLQSGVAQIFSTYDAFAALKDDGSVITWGTKELGDAGDSSSVAGDLLSGVSQIFSTRFAFAALKEDGSVITWGDGGLGGDSSSVAGDLQSGVSEIFSTHNSFAALKDDGSVITWGPASMGGDSSTVSDDLQSGVAQIYSTSFSFAALKEDGSVITWGDGGLGGDSSSVSAELSSGVAQIFSTETAFAALKEDGSVITWGNKETWGAGDSSSVAGDLQAGVSQIFSTSGAFAALKDDGSVITWGESSNGGDSSSVSNDLQSGVAQIFSTYNAFAALKDDGSVITWGNPDMGGDSSTVSDDLQSGVVSFADPFQDDRLVPGKPGNELTSDPSPALYITIDSTGETISISTPEPTLTGNPPNLIKATLRGKDITLQFDNLLSNTLPRNSRFTLNQGNREYLVVDTRTRASAGIVKLTAEKELDPTVAVTLDYLDFPGDQSRGVIESPTGVDLESFTGFALNNQGFQVNSLTVDDGEFEGSQITLYLTAPISDAIPSKRRFNVKAANKKQNILSISTEPDDGIIVLTTKKNLGLQESVFVSYRDLGGDQVRGVIEDLAGNDMATIQDFEIASGGNDAIAPMVASATLDENTLSVEFDSIIRDTSISKNRFKVKVNGKKVRVLSATVEQNDSYVDLALQPKNLRRIDINSSVTLSYKDPKGDQTSKVVEDMFGNDLDSFSGYGVEIVKI